MTGGDLAVGSDFGTRIWTGAVGVVAGVVANAVAVAGAVCFGGDGAGAAAVQAGC